MKQINGSTAATSIFNAAVHAVQPRVLMPAYVKATAETLHIGGESLPLQDFDGIYLLSVGKAASAMALELEKIIGSHLSAGLVVTKYQHSQPLRYCKTIEAGHPVPDENSLAAAPSINSFLAPLTAKSLLLCCISGGASALVADCAEGIPLADMQTVSALLLQCGADIHEINTVRKHLSFLKGGQLVRQANGAVVYSLIISDVAGDDISIIASGLTAPDPSTFADAWAVLAKYGLTQNIPATAQAHLLKGIKGQVGETPKPGDALFSNLHNQTIGNNQMALQAAALQATALGFSVTTVEDLLVGEARDAAGRFVQLLTGYTGKRPACFLAGGETTVTIRGTGKGGRNQEFALAALCQLLTLGLPAKHWPVILSAGTDGTDGPTGAAGAIVNISNFLHILKTPSKADISLQNNDSFNFFEPINALLITGYTQTNVMDIVIGLLY